MIRLFLNALISHFPVFACLVLRYPARVLFRFFYIFLSLLTGLVVSGPALGAPGIKIGGGAGINGFKSVYLERMQDFAQSFQTRDLNFKSDGVVSFTGIRLDRLLQLAGKDPGMDLTVIGSDQYVGFLPAHVLEQGFLVWEMGGRPIPGLKGGPLKIIFPDTAGIHSACYTWYVSALVQGMGDKGRLTVILNGVSRQYCRTDLEPMATGLDRSLFSIPQGCRNAFKGMSRIEQIRAVPLSALLENAGAKNGHSAGSVRFVSFTGAAADLDPDILKADIFLVVSWGSQPLHPALGGPFSVIFPLESYPELIEKVPEPGAFFFIEQIVIN